MRQLLRARRLLVAVVLLMFVAAAAGTYFIADNARRGAFQPEQGVTEGRKRCTVPVVPNPTIWDTCTCTFTDVRKFEQPIIIAKPTTWECVDYAVTSIHITPTGSLTVINSSLRFPTEDVNANFSMWQGLLNWGQLRIYSSRIGLPTVVEPTPEAVFEAHDSNLTDTQTLGGSTLLKGVKPYFVTWGCDVKASGAAQVTLVDSNIDLLKIEPMTSFIDINGFNTTSLAIHPTDYDFQAKWGLERPLVRLLNVTAKSFELDIMAGRSALISNSQFSTSEEYGGYSNHILIHGGNVIMVDSKLGTVWGIRYDSVQVREGGLLNVEHSEVSYVSIDSGDCTVSSSKLHGLELYAYQEETITINGFDEDRDGGNYDFTSWGFTHFRVNTFSSNVQGIAVVSSGARAWVTGSKLGGISASGGYVYISDSQLQNLEIDNNGFGKVYQTGLGSIGLSNGAYGEVSNSTVKYSAEADAGAVVNFLNVALPPSFVDEVDYIITRGGRMVVSWYVFVKVYDAKTQMPLTGVSLTARAATGNTTSFAVDGSNRIVLVSYVRMGGGEKAHEHGGDMFYFPYNLTATREGYLSSRAEINELWNDTAIEIYMQPVTTQSSTTPPNQITTHGEASSQTLLVVDRSSSVVSVQLSKLRKRN
jgi:hypothetical protein